MRSQKGQEKAHLMLLESGVSPVLNAAARWMKGVSQSSRAEALGLLGMMTSSRFHNDQ